MFEDKGSFSYTLNLPLVKELKQALGYIDKPDKQGLPQMPVQGKLGYQGGNTWPVYCYAKELANKTANLYFRIGLGGFYEAIKNLTLQDLTLGGERTIEAPATDLDLQYPDSDYALFPVKNENFQDDTSAETDYKTYVIYQNYPIGIHQFKEIITPFPYVGYVLQQIFEENGYTVIYNIFRTHTELKKLCEFNVQDITTLKKTGASNTFTHSKTYLKLHLPELSVDQYLQNIKNRYNVGFFINEHSKTVKILLLEELVANAQYLESPDYSELKSIIETTYTSVRITTTTDENDEAFQFYSIADIEEFYDDIKGSVATYADLLTLNPVYARDVYFVEATKNYYRLTITWNDEDEEFPDYSWTLISGTAVMDYFSTWDDNALEIENNISFLTFTTETDDRLGTRNWKVPYCLQKGNSVWRPDKVSFSHRHLLYQGLQEDAEGNDYPFASFDYKDKSGNYVGGLQLSYYDYYETGDNLIDYFFSKWINWKLNIARTFETWINFPTYMLFSFPWEKKFRIDNTNYFIKKIEVDLRYKGPVIKKVEIVKC